MKTSRQLLKSYGYIAKHTLGWCLTSYTPSSVWFAYFEPGDLSGMIKELKGKMLQEVDRIECVS